METRPETSSLLSRIEKYHEIGPNGTETWLIVSWHNYDKFEKIIKITPEVRMSALNPQKTEEKNGFIAAAARIEARNDAADIEPDSNPKTPEQIEEAITDAVDDADRQGKMLIILSSMDGNLNDFWHRVAINS